MPKMKVVFVTRKFPPSVGGMERFAYDLQGAIDKKCRVFLVKWGGSNAWLPIIVPYLFVRSLLVTIFWQPDVIHVQDGVLAPVGYVLSLLTRKPWVIVIHGLDVTYKSALFQNVNIRCLRRAAQVFCISKAAAQEAMKRGVPEQKIQIIPLGITDEHAMTRPAAREMLAKQLELDVEKYILLLTTGRLVKRKGVAWFIEHVMPDLVQSLPNALYLVVGKGEQQSVIAEAIKRKNLEAHVRMLGEVSDELLEALYKGTDMFVMPNIKVPGDMEGFGRVAIEASVAELPIVASDMEGIQDAISTGKNGVLVPSRDAKAFEQEIVKFTDRDHARSFGQKSRAYTLRRFEWNAIAEQYIGGYRKTLK